MKQLDPGRCPPPHHHTTAVNPSAPPVLTLRSTCLPATAPMGRDSPWPLPESPHPAAAHARCQASHPRPMPSTRPLFPGLPINTACPCTPNAIPLHPSPHLPSIHSHEHPPPTPHQDPSLLPHILSSIHPSPGTPLPFPHVCRRARSCSMCTPTPAECHSWPSPTPGHSHPSMGLAVGEGRAQPLQKARRIFLPTISVAQGPPPAPRLSALQCTGGQGKPQRLGWSVHLPWSPSF